jgi:hypothetical protein
MLARLVLFLGAVVLGALLLLQRPVPMAIAPSDLQPDRAGISAKG